MSPFCAKSVPFDPENQKHLDHFAVSFEGYTLSLEYVGGVMDSLRVVTTTPEGVELTRPRFWNKWCPSLAIDDTFQHELLPLIAYRKAQAAA